MINDCNEVSVFCCLKVLYIKIYKISKYVNCKVILLEIMFLAASKGLAGKKMVSGLL